MREAKVPLQVVLKVASRCNLNCSYCYVYNKGDDSWKDRPAIMPEEVFSASLERIATHCKASKQPSVSVTLHGGEPCAIGVERFDDWCSQVRGRLAGSLRLKLSLQTNGTLLNEKWARVLAKHGVHVGISLDGPKAMNDAFRVDHAGKGSYDEVLRGLNTVREAGVPVQILAVIQFGVDSLAVHRHFKGLGAAMIHYLLPDFNHDTVQTVRDLYGPTPCADYLLPILNDWAEDGLESDVSIFRTIARLILGGDTNADVFGNQPLRYVFIETDGQLEMLDVLRTCSNRILATRLNVLKNELCELTVASALHRELMLEGPALPTGCRSCVESETCAGGYLPHRYSGQRSFDNPSIWCADLLKLFSEMRMRLGVDFEGTQTRREMLAEIAHEQLRGGSQFAEVRA
jgi:uncharacterized protein